MSELIYLNRRQLLEVQDLVHQLEQDVACAADTKDGMGLAQLEASLEVARHVLDRCLVLQPFEIDH